MKFHYGQKALLNSKLIEGKLILMNAEPGEDN